MRNPDGGRLAVNHFVQRKQPKMHRISEAKFGLMPASEAPFLSKGFRGSQVLEI